MDEVKRMELEQRWQRLMQATAGVSAKTMIANDAMTRLLGCRVFRDGDDVLLAAFTDSRNGAAYRIDFVAALQLAQDLLQAVEQIVPGTATVTPSFGPPRERQN